MNNYGGYITPEEAIKAGDTRTLKELQYLAKKKTGKCVVCGDAEWKYAGCNMCFSCTTGESDASDDLEIHESK
jgi:hypothetical protein